MARKPKQRASYYQDSQFLLRMGEAILNDHRLPMDWRGRVEAKARDLATELITAPIDPEPDA